MALQQPLFHKKNGLKKFLWGLKYTFYIGTGIIVTFIDNSKKSMNYLFNATKWPRQQPVIWTLHEMLRNFHQYYCLLSITTRFGTLYLNNFPR